MEHDEEFIWGSNDEDTDLDDKKNTLNYFELSLEFQRIFICPSID